MILATFGLDLERGGRPRPCSISRHPLSTPGTSTSIALLHRLGRPPGLDHDRRLVPGANLVELLIDDDSAP